MKRPSSLKDTLRWAHEWIKTHKYCLWGLYMIVFLLGFLLLELFSPEPVIYLHCLLDDIIPFNEWFVIPYFLWYAWIPVFMIYFMIKDRESYLKLCFILFAGSTLCLFIYAFLPNGLQLRQEITATNVCAWIVKTIRSIDPPRNVCPSLHVSSTVAVHIVLLGSKEFRNNRKMKALSWIITLLICLSTVMIKQHSVIDVICGWILSIVFWMIWQIGFVSRI